MLGYVDPGTGSYFFQILIGGLLGVAIGIKAFWSRIVGFFRRKPRHPAQDETTSTHTDR